MPERELALAGEQVGAGDSAVVLDAFSEGHSESGYFHHLTRNASLQSTGGQAFLRMASVTTGQRPVQHRKEERKYSLLVSHSRGLQLRQVCMPMTRQRAAPNPAKLETPPETNTLVARKYKDMRR